MGTLDKVKGGEIAENLEQLYVFMIEQLVNANIKKDKKPVIVVRDLMTDLLETWKKII
jgi:flagellar protein FliS